MARIGLSVYGTVFTMGLHPSSTQPRITPLQLMAQALKHNLRGVEMPVSLLDGENIATVAQYARDNQLFISLAASGTDHTVLKNAIQLASQLGAEEVRTVVGGAKIGGDRRPMAGRWQHFMHEVQQKLRGVTTLAERAGVNIAVENHQDLASEELLWLCESIASPHFGITLDTGNPLATAEEPVDFARRVAPFIKNIHLKDYYIYLSEEGYRLVRSPLGQGVVNFPALFDIFASACPNAPMVVELGALEARHIRLLSADYWDEYPPRSARQLAPVLRFALDNARLVGNWRTPYEREEPQETIISYEKQQLAASLAYLAAL